MCSRFTRALHQATFSPEVVQGRPLYHGTSTEKAAQQIISTRQLIQPKEGQDAKYGSLKPVEGAVYITPRLDYAMIYALGGDYAGSEPFHGMLREGKDPYAYLFQVDPTSVHDVTPDEDSIGEFVWDNKLPWLTDMAKAGWPAWYQNAVRGEYIWWARLGKAIQKRLTDPQKLALIAAGAHIAHNGTLSVAAGWRFEKARSKELARDGSNFIQLSEKIL